MSEGILERGEALLKTINQKLESGELIGGYVDQSRSPLGKKHCKVVRRRLAEGKDGAAKIGRVHILSHEALKEELQRESSSDLTFPHPADNDDFYRDLMKKVGA